MIFVFIFVVFGILLLWPLISGYTPISILLLSEILVFGMFGRLSLLLVSCGVPQGVAAGAALLCRLWTVLVEVAVTGVAFGALRAKATADAGAPGSIRRDGS